MKTKTSIWTGRIISWICILFLLVDAIMKIVLANPSVEGSKQLGVQDYFIQPIGFILLIFTILYLLSRTAIIGAILITFYLGAATAYMVHASSNGQYPYLFPIIFCVLIWLGLHLQNDKVKKNILGD